MAINFKFLKFLPTCLLIILFLILLTEIFWPKNFLEITKTGVANWPHSAKAHLKFTQALFRAGYQEPAEKELRLAQKSLKLTTSKELFQETEEIIREPKVIQKEINTYEEILKEKPWYRDVLLNLALLYDRLYMREKSKEYFDKAFYLDPLNEKVQAVGKALGFL